MSCQPMGTIASGRIVSTVVKRLAPKLGQELRLTDGQLGERMNARPDLFRKTAKGWFASLPGPA